MPLQVKIFRIHMARKKVVDCFIFYNEIDILQYRLGCWAIW